MRFAYRKEFVTEPLAEALRARGWETVADDRPDVLLGQGRADVVLTPPLDYANAIGVIEMALVPGVAITTSGFAGLIKLMFNKGLAGFSTMAARDPHAAETIVAVMLLSEKHDLEPKVIQVAPDASLGEMLAVADCALLTGDDALFDTSGSTSLLDLTDEWEDTVEAPLPYMIAWGRMGAVPQVALEELRAARDEAVLMLPGMAAHHEHAAAANAFYQRYLRGEIVYTLGPVEVAALDAYYRYAFYYSVIPDIPALKFLPDGELAPIAPPGV
ncbi:MAG: hypothetical protein JST22_07045 [Bacteroidetes bacterium]|nr:hypothetical protein [Bacteroidota bacterium]